MSRRKAVEYRRAMDDGAERNGKKWKWQHEKI